MLSNLLTTFGLKEEPPLAPAPGVRPIARAIEVGDVLHAYVPRKDAPNRPGPLATPCIVLGRDTSQGRPVLLVSPLRELPKGAPAASGTQMDITSPDALKSAGINRAARIDAADQRIVPMEAAFFAAGSRVGAIGSLDDRTFEAMRGAYRSARQAQHMREETRRINLQAGYGRISTRRAADLEVA